jgi:hypothetical protein
MGSTVCITPGGGASYVCEFIPNGAVRIVSDYWDSWGSPPGPGKLDPVFDTERRDTLIRFPMTKENNVMPQGQEGGNPRTAAELLMDLDVLDGLVDSALSKVREAYRHQIGFNGTFVTPAPTPAL